MLALDGMSWRRFGVLLRGLGPHAATVLVQQAEARGDRLLTEDQEIDDALERLLG